MKSERKQHPVLGEFVTFKSTMSLAEAIYATKYPNKAAKMDNFDDVRDKIDLISKQTLKRMRVHVVEKDATSFVSGMHNVIRTVKGKYRPVISFGDTLATTSGGRRPFNLPRSRYLSANLKKITKASHKRPFNLPPSSEGQYLLDLAANSKNRQITNPTNASNNNVTTNATITDPSRSMFEDTKNKALKYLDDFISTCQLYYELYVSTSPPKLKHPLIPSRAWLEDTLGALRNAKTTLENNQPIDSSSNSGKLLNNIMSRSLGEIFTEKYRELKDGKKAVMNIVTYNTLQDQYKNGTPGDSRSARYKRRQPAMHGGNGNEARDRKKSRLEDLFPNGSPAHYNRSLKINSDLKHDFKDSKEIGDNLTSLYEDGVEPVDEATFVRNILLHDGINTNDLDIRYNNNNEELPIKFYTEDTGMSANVKEAFMLDKYVKCTTLPSLFDPSTSGRSVGKDPLISFDTFESKPIESPLIPNPLKPTETIPLRKLYEFFDPAQEDEENTLSRIDQVRDAIYKDILRQKIEGVADDPEAIDRYIKSNKSNKTLLNKIYDILRKYYNYKKFCIQKKKIKPKKNPKFKLITNLPDWEDNQNPPDNDIVKSVWFNYEDPNYENWFSHLSKEQLWKEVIEIKKKENKEKTNLWFGMPMQNQQIGYKNDSYQKLIDLYESVKYFIDNPSFDETKYKTGVGALKYLYDESDNTTAFIIYALNDHYEKDNGSGYVEENDIYITYFTEMYNELQNAAELIKTNQNQAESVYYDKKTLQNALRNTTQSISNINIETSSILEIAGYIKHIHEKIFEPALGRLKKINYVVGDLFRSESDEIKNHVNNLLKLCNDKVIKYIKINTELYESQYQYYDEYHESNTLWNELLDLHQDAYFLINVIYEYTVTKKMKTLEKNEITVEEVKNLYSEITKPPNDQQNDQQKHPYEKDFEIMNAICENFYPDLIKFESQKIDDDGNMVFTCLLNGNRVTIPAGLFSKETVSFLFLTIHKEKFDHNLDVRSKNNKQIDIQAKNQVFNTYQNQKVVKRKVEDKQKNLKNLKKLLRLKTLGDHMQLYYVKYLNLNDKPIFITTNDRILFGSALFTRTPCMFHTMTPQGWLPTLKYIKSLQLWGLYRKHKDTKQELINKFKDALCERHIADIFGEIKTRTSSSDEDDEGSKYMHLGVFYNPTQEKLQDGEDWTTKGEASLTNDMNERKRSRNSNALNTRSNSNKGKAPMTNTMNASPSTTPNNPSTSSSNERKRSRTNALNINSRQIEQTKTTDREWGIFLMPPPSQGQSRNVETVKITFEINGKNISDYIGLYEFKKNCWYPVETKTLSISNNEKTSYSKTLDVKNPDCNDNNYIAKFTTDYGVPRNSEIYKYVEKFVRIEEEKRIEE